MSEGWFITAFVGSILALFGAFFGFAVVVGNHGTHVSCLRLSEVTGLQTTVRGIVDPDCFILVNDQWVREDRWRVVDQP